MNENKLLTRRQYLQIMYLTKSVHPKYIKSPQNSKENEHHQWPKLNRRVTKEAIQRANNPRKTSTSLVIREMVIKGTVRCHQILVTGWRGCRATETLRHSWWGKQHRGFFESTECNMHILYDPEVPILRIHRREMKT